MRARRVIPVSHARRAPTDLRPREVVRERRAARRVSLAGDTSCPRGAPNHRSRARKPSVATRGAGIEPWSDRRRRPPGAAELRRPRAGAGPPRTRAPTRLVRRPTAPGRRAPRLERVDLDREHADRRRVEPGGPKPLTNASIGASAGGGPCAKATGGWPASRWSGRCGARGSVLRAAAAPARHAEIARPVCDRASTSSSRRIVPAGARGTASRTAYAADVRGPERLVDRGVPRCTRRSSLPGTMRARPSPASSSQRPTSSSAGASRRTSPAPRWHR